ncbi:MAG: hypothetical protein ACI8Y4_004843 [Candidatus Poriferisodalaceae bacterium]|jgi:hypothetical protein
MASASTSSYIDIERHPIDDDGFASHCRDQLDAEGALILRGFFTPEVIQQAAAESAGLEPFAFYSNAVHNVYLTATDPELPEDHPFNRPVVSNKGLIADDLIAAESPLRQIYEDLRFRSFLGLVLGIEKLHPYPDMLSSIVISVAGDGMELGWHFDTSASSVTMLLQAPDSGGTFEYVPDVRDADAGDMAFEKVDSVLDGQEPAMTLDFKPGDLVLFRGRNALHRVTPAVGTTTRSLAIFAFNERPDASMSEEALMTFFGRTT